MTLLHPTGADGGVLDLFELAGRNAERATVLLRDLLAAWLVASGTVSAIASDAHSDWRGPALGLGLEKASWSLTPHRARMLTDSGPTALLERGVPAFAPAA